MVLKAVENQLLIASNLYRIMSFQFTRLHPLNNHAPMSLALTEFHYFLLYKDRIRTVCLLNDEIVQEEFLESSFGKVKRFIVDDYNHTYWFFSEKKIFEIIIEEEDKNVWKLFMEKKNFDAALAHCKVLNEFNGRITCKKIKFSSVKPIIILTMADILLQQSASLSHL